MSMANHLRLIGDLAEGDFRLGSADNSADLEKTKCRETVSHDFLIVTLMLAKLYLIRYS